MLNVSAIIIKKMKKVRHSKKAKGSKHNYAVPPEVIHLPTKEELLKAKTDAQELHLEELKFRGVVQEWPDYFFVIEVDASSQTKKQFAAFLDGKLAQRSEALYQNIVSDEAILITDALWRLDRISPEILNELSVSLSGATSQTGTVNAHTKECSITMDGQQLQALEWTVAITSALKSALGTDLHTIRYFRNGEHDFSIDAMIAKFQASLLVYNNRQHKPRSHGNADTFKFKMPNDQTELVSLPWLAIEFARKLVEKNLVLPKKQEVRLAVCEEYPELKTRSMGSWAEIWAKAGLKDLHRAENFSHPRNKHTGSAK